MNVLITGAFGYLGMHLAQKLAQKHHVIAIGRRPRKAAVLAAANELSNLASVMYGDMTQFGPPMFRDVDAVVHLAGVGGSAGHMIDPTRAAIDNVVATVHVAKITADCPTKLFASSIYAYGPMDRPARESDQCTPDTLYGIFKKSAEMVWHFFGGTSLRLSHVYGVGSGLGHGRVGVTETFAKAAARGDAICVFGDGSMVIDMVHIDDVVSAIGAALSVDGGLPEAINIGSGAPLPLNTLAAIVQQAGVSNGVYPSILHLDPPDGRVWHKRTLDVTLAEQLLGWAPHVSAEEGMLAMVEHATKTRTTHMLANDAGRGTT